MKIVFISEDGARISESSEEFTSVEQAQKKALSALVDWVKAQPVGQPYLASAITGFAGNDEQLFRVVLEVSFMSPIDTLNIDATTH